MCNFKKTWIEIVLGAKDAENRNSSLPEQTNKMP